MNYSSSNSFRLILVSILFAFVFYGCSEDNNPIENGSEYDVSVSRLLNELNMVRTTPKQYAQKLQQRLTRYDGNRYTDENGKVWLTSEGSAAVQEAISVLNSTQAIGALTYNSVLSQPCQYHVNDIGPRGLTQHEGSNGESFVDRIGRYFSYGHAGECISFGNVSAEEVVAMLIIDDGVSSRGHRTNILTGNYNYVGFAWGYHSAYGMMCVMDFADFVTPKK